MIKVVFAMFTVVFEDLKLCCNNANLLLRKSAIWFELLVQKGERSKQTADMLHYKY